MCAARCPSWPSTRWGPGPGHGESWVQGVGCTATADRALSGRRICSAGKSRVKALSIPWSMRAGEARAVGYCCPVLYWLLEGVERGLSCCSAVKNLVDSGVYFRSVEGLLKQAISIREHMGSGPHSQGHR